MFFFTPLIRVIIKIYEYRGLMLTPHHFIDVYTDHLINQKYKDIQPFSPFEGGRRAC